MKDLISVVVTCYNHEDYIEQCLRSIFKQNYRNIELFVFNDGSTDKSAQIIQETLRDSPFPTQFKSHENMGLVMTRNKGLGLINGEFFLFVDSDNFLDEAYIEKCHQKLCQAGADIAYSDLYDPEREKIYLKGQPFDLSSFLERSYIDSCSLVRTEIVKGVVYDVELNYKKLEDYDFWLNLIINRQAVPIYVQDTKLNYRVLESSMSQRNSTKYYFDVYLYVLKKYLDKIPQEVYQALSDNIFTLEGRLDDLIQHTAKVADYVSELKGELSTLKGTIETLKISVKKIKHQRDEAIEEQFEIRHSISYRLGNAMITPLKYIGQIIRNPRNIKGVLSLMKQQLILLRHIIINYCAILNVSRLQI